jgi:LacI family transcriptional regulator
MSEERVTIRQLAQLSGVSIGTVSRALNGYTDVSPETRARVMRLARELDYTPAAAARSLKTQRSQVIGVFLETGEGHPDLQHPFFHEVLVGHAYLKRCQHHSVEGAVLMGADPEDPEVRRLARSELPTVGVDLDIEGPATTFVISDNIDGAARAVRYFHSIGHRRIATITGLLDKRPGADRLRGYRQALQACGLAYRDEYVAYGDFYVESGRRAMADLLSLDEPPTAVFAASDMMALGAIRAAGDLGLNVPADVSVIGFDDIQLADHMNPPLTTVRQDKAGLGVAAGAALVRLIEGQQDDVGPSTVLPVELVRRGSTRPRAES